eukprot:tig00000655_g2866.t1
MPLSPLNVGGAIAALRNEIEATSEAAVRMEAAAGDLELEATRGELKAALKRERAAQRAAQESVRLAGELRSQLEAAAAEAQGKEEAAQDALFRLELAQAELAKVEELQKVLAEREATVGELRALVQQLRESSAGDQRRIEELLAAGARMQAEAREQAVEIRGGPKEEALPKIERFLKRMEETNKVTAERWEAKKGLILQETRRRLEALLVVVDKEQDRAKTLTQIASLIDTQAAARRVAANGRGVGLFVPKLQTAVAAALAEAAQRAALAASDRAQTERAPPRGAAAARERFTWSPPERRPNSAVLGPPVRRAVLELELTGAPRTAPGLPVALPPARGAFDGLAPGTAPRGSSARLGPGLPRGRPQPRPPSFRRRYSGSEESGNESGGGGGGGLGGLARPLSGSVTDGEAFFRRPAGRPHQRTPGEGGTRGSPTRRPPLAIGAGAGPLRRSAPESVGGEGPPLGLPSARFEHSRGSLPSASRGRHSARPAHTPVYLLS